MGVMTLVLDFMRRDEPKMDMSNVVSAPVVPKPDVFSDASADGACMLYIKKMLHDPDSAQFEHSRESSIIANGARAVVVRSVRAKNAFGAMRKKDFWCFLELRNDQIYPVFIGEDGNEGEMKRVSVLLKDWGLAGKK
ncbi:hypothetical protein GCM10011282_04400 [Undibacterium macrobrachii]|uniref:Uncharacterized protein n=2 Tax=Undibacterium macrobrachii TaxID=1119058 RepID=A0ABQ2X6B3_9BURK|nr:hypothetical protein GCM10011282_04400 [Undibacterium macrobrachii]